MAFLQGRILDPGERIFFNKVWGFTVDTPNTEMTYRFEFQYEVGNAKSTVNSTRDLVLKPVD